MGMANNAENDGHGQGVSSPLSRRKAGKEVEYFSRTASPAIPASNDSSEAQQRTSHDGEWLSSAANFNAQAADVVDHEHQVASPVVTQSESGPKAQGGRVFEDQQHSLTPAESMPIAIDLPTRKRQFHTPLSARGDLIGGYFPFHETHQRSFETHPFNKPSSKGYRDYHSEMLTDSPLSVTEPSQHNSPYRHHYMQSPQELNFAAMGNEAPETPPLVSMPPLGKYHPANYQNKSISLQPPRSQSTSQPPRSITSPFERAKSDVKNNKQLLQKYQRDMVEQATRAARRVGATVDNPGAPKLAPLGSPGPVTPMELEQSNAAGYLLAGAMNGSSYRQGENRKEADMVGRMIRAEEERRRREGQSSPLATAGGH